MRDAIHVLQDEVRHPVGRRATVEETGDVRMSEIGENLPLVLESPQNGLGLESAAHDLDRDVFLIFLVVSRCEIDLPHPTVPELADDSVGANASKG